MSAPTPPSMAEAWKMAVDTGRVPWEGLAAGQTIMTAWMPQTELFERITPATEAVGYTYTWRLERGIEDTRWFLCGSGPKMRQMMPVFGPLGNWPARNTDAGMLKRALTNPVPL